MARNPKTPAPLSPESFKYQKTTSYSPAQYNRLRSSGGPEKSWGGGSYDSKGRGNNSRAPGYGGSPAPGPHTLDNIGED